MLLYPAGVKASDVKYSAFLRMPAGWKFATALAGGQDKPGSVFFEPVSLETLVDSPVIMGTWLRTIDLTPGEHPGHTLNLVSDSAAALEIKPEDTRHFAHLVAETGALFGARHYGSYHFLLTLSDHVAHFGLEHHESSDDREGEQYLTDGDYRNAAAYLLCHEMVHSWNGKYRRPAGLATPDFQQPMKDELLWVYEGLTDYLGIVLTARSGLLDEREFPGLRGAGSGRVGPHAGPGMASAGRHGDRGASALRGAGGAGVVAAELGLLRGGRFDLAGGRRVDPAENGRREIAGRFLQDFPGRRKRPAQSRALHGGQRGGGAE